MYFATVSLLALYATTTSAYSATRRTFAVNHFYGKGNLVTGRMDPIVNPGVASSHVHAIQGGSNFALTMTDTQALESNCTSSRVKNDKSNYWTPSLYFVDPVTGSIESVDLFYMNVYYFFEATTDKIMAFKPGHRMVIGNPNLRTPPPTGGQTILDLADGTPVPVGWTCPRSSTAQPLYPVNSDGLHGAGIQDPNNKGSGVGFPDQNCDGYASPLRADIHFPSCWNPAVGLEDYHNNMQFPTNGNCPTGWVHVPHLFYEVYWDTLKFASRWTPGQGTQPFVLSNGDPTGYGLHGDFISGWDEATLQQMIDNCDAGDLGMDKCPGLIGGTNDPSTTCNIPSAIQETIFGVVPVLPGNNTIGTWGTDVVPKATSPAASGNSPTSTASHDYTPPVVNAAAGETHTSHQTSTTTLTRTTSTTATVTTTTQSSSAIALPNGWSSMGCYSDARGSSRVLTGIKFANVGGSITSSNCAKYCSDSGFSIAGTEYGRQCFCGNALVGSTKVADSACNMPCKGDSTQNCGGNLLLSIFSSQRDVGAKMNQKLSRRTHSHNHLG